MKKLTPRQFEVLALIKGSIESTGMPPTRAEIARHLGFRSANAAEDHLRALCRKGVIEIIPGTSRGIRVISSDNNPDEAIKESLPVIGRVAAGEPILACEHIESHCHLSPDFFSPCANYLLKVQGDSMKNIGILDGDYVAVHQQKTAETGQVVVARIDNEVTVKRLEIRENSLFLHPENPEYDSIHVPDSCMDFAIEGVYVGVIRHT